MKRLLAAITVLLAFALVFSACTTGEEERVYRDAADGRYGDALSLSGIVGEQGQIVREVVFDTRLEGWHYLGVEARAGETLTFELDETYAEYGLVATVGRGGAFAETTTLTGEVCEWTPTVSGTVEVWLGNCIGTQGGSLRVSGGYAASYYRYGIDDTAQVSADGIIDGADVRIYLCGNGAEGSNVAGTAMWWRSAVQLVNSFLGKDFGVDNGVPIDMFVLGDTLRVDFGQGIVYVPASSAQDVCDYDALVGGSAWDVLLSVVELVTRDAGYSDEAKRWMTALIYVLMTDGASEGGGSPEGIGSGAACLQRTLDGVEQGQEADYLFADLMHSFGVEKATEFIQTYEIGDNFADAFYTAALQVYGVDCADFIAGLGLTVSDGVRDANAPTYVAVQSYYTLGANADNATGTVVKAGERTAFDFESSIVTTASEYAVSLRSDHPERWSESGGLWYYSPAADAVEDSFTLAVTADGREYLLEGKLTYDIAVGNVAVYEDVPYRDIDEAVDDYEDDLAPTEVFATDVAGTGTSVEEDESSAYVFVVGSGSIQVDETADYEIHLRNRGVVRVDFGVPEYMFTMFRNSLTVDEYFGELYYSLELQAGVVYDYEIYALSTKDSCFAELGIRKAGSDDPVESIGKDMLIYDGYDRSQIEGYQALDIKPRYFDLNPEERVPLDTSVVASVDAPTGREEGYASLTDGDRHTVYPVAQTAATQVYAMHLVTSRIDYFAFDCTVAGLDYSVYAGNSAADATLVAQGRTREGMNYAQFEGGSSTGYVELQLSSDTPFGDCVADLSVGTTRPECTVVPSDGSGVFYQGGWTDQGGVIGVNGKIMRSYGRDAAIEYSFRGEYVSVYCAKGPAYGNMLVYLDGVLQTNVDLSSDTDEYGCLVWSRVFAEGGEHTIRLVADTSHDVINLDFFGVIFTEAQDVPPEYGNLYYIAIIPAVLIVVLAVCIGLDIADKRKRRVRMSEPSGEDGDKN